MRDHSLWCSRWGRTTFRELLEYLHPQKLGNNGSSREENSTRNLGQDGDLPFIVQFEFFPPMCMNSLFN